VRNLTLTTERLTELTTEELNRIDGAAAAEAVTTQPTLCIPTLHGCTTNIYCP
jgi:hypothetical protein